jgi:hypothetical protein
MLRCPGCSRAGDDVGHCGSHRTCPITNGQAAVDVDPAKDVVMACTRCGVTRSTPVTKFFNQHSAAPVDMEFRCPVGVDSCQAFVMLPPAPKAEPKAPRGKAPGDAV